MSIFVVVATDSQNQNVTRLGELIVEKYAENSVNLKDDAWLIYEDEVFQPQVVYQGLLGNDNSVSCLIVPVGAYWGIQPKGVWDWLQSKGL